MKKAGMSFLLSGRCIIPTTYFIIILVLVYITGCAGLSRKTEKVVSPQAQDLIDRLDHQNAHLLHLKGLGSYRLVNGDGRMSGRMGWGCSLPDRFRADILDVVGRPVATIASDGQWLYARLKGEQKTHKRSNTSAVFKKMIGSPVSSKEITAFLSGRVPVCDYQAAQVRAGDDQTSILSLKRESNNLTQEVFFNKDTLSAKRVVFYSKAGKVTYVVDLGSPIVQDGHTFFKSLSFKSTSRNRFDLQVDKLWFGVNMPNRLFELNDP